MIYSLPELDIRQAAKDALCCAGKVVVVVALVLAFAALATWLWLISRG